MIRLKIRSFITVVFAFVLTALSSQALAITPKAGIWWNPSESGRGYSIDVNGNTLVMAVYAYNTTGAAQWYLAVGSLTNNGTQWQGTLDKYTNGPCMGCTFSPNQVVGNDGIVSIAFTSDTSGVLTMPNGTKSNIQTFFTSPANSIVSGFPLQFKNFLLTEMTTEFNGISCEATLSYRKTSSSPESGFFSFDVIQNSQLMGQIKFAALPLGAGLTGQSKAYVTYNVPSNSCTNFTLQFNSTTSRIN